MERYNTYEPDTNESGSVPESKLKKLPSLNEFFNFSPVPCFVINSEGNIYDANPAALNMLGIQKDSIINNLFDNHISPEDHSVYNNSRFELIESGKPQACELRIQDADLKLLQVKLDMALTKNENDYLILLAITDLTYRKQIDDTQNFLSGHSWLKSGRNFFEGLAEYIAKTLNIDYVCIDRLEKNNGVAQTVAVYFDGNYAENVSYTLEDTPCAKVVGNTVCCFPGKVRELFPKDKVLQEMVAESYAGVTLWGSDGKPIGLIAAIGRKPMANTSLAESLLKQVSIRAAFELEYRLLEKNIIRSHSQLEKIVRERTYELRKTNAALQKEIRIRKQKEETLLKTEEKYRTVADFTYDWETWLGTDGKFIYVSPSCERITGYTVEEFMNDPSLVISITHPDDRKMVEDHYKEKHKINLPSSSLDFRIITRDGEKRWIGHSCQPVLNEEGKWIGQRGTNRDITDIKKTESSLMASHIQLRALTQRIDAIAEEERTRIAREIHDELGHVLTVLKYDIETLISNRDISVDMIKSELKDTLSMIDSLIDTVRTIASDLRPGILDHLGLIPAIEWKIEQFQKRTNITCECDIENIDEQFSSIETTVIFRILQEILTNIARHSRARKISVSLNRKDDHIFLTIADNGIGFDKKSIMYGDCLGLLGIQERALSIGGRVEIDSKPGKGTRVTLSIKKNS